MSPDDRGLSGTVTLAQQLIRRRSVTPEDAGCQELLRDLLVPLGFSCEFINREGVTNLWARRGQAQPLVVFAGHTDVVPTGPLEHWEIAPFEGTIKNGMLHGRGAADMKGSIASFMEACDQFIAAHPDHGGSIGLLITSDEEGPAQHGTLAVLDALNARNEQIDMCLVGEPTSTSKIGDVIKVGRRGSLGANLTVRGIQGHIAYPHLAANPIHSAMPALSEIINFEWDSGNNNFQPTSLQLSNFNAGTGATNIIPGAVDIHLNIRFSPMVTEQHLRITVENILDTHQLDYDIQWQLSGQPFETKPGQLINAVSDSIQEITGHHPSQSTSGGTSDGRFISLTGAQVVELGPVNETIHKINEQVSVKDLELLTSCYQKILEKLLL